MSSHIAELALVIVGPDAEELAEHVAAYVADKYGPDGVPVAGIDAVIARASVESIAVKRKRS